MRAGTPTVGDLRGDAGFAGDYATALLRFADQSVLMPTRAVKPTWASSPLGSLVFALQSYNYGFAKNVLARVGRETIAGVSEKDPARLSAAAGLVALMGVTSMVTGLRHLIYGSATGNQDETPMQYALESADRAGLFGGASWVLNAIEGVRYKRSTSQAIQGSVIGRAAEAADAVGGLAFNKSTDTNTAERKAAGAVYDIAVRPAINAIGAGVLRGPVGAATIMGTGGRPGGLAIPDKEAFRTATAGAKV